jgi:hypothetical protein
MNADQTSLNDELKRGDSALLMLILGLALGWIVILGFAFSTSEKLTVFAVGSMVATASLLAGLFFGFLFGIPRTLQKNEDENAYTAKADSADAGRSSYRPNTNLEQISDWLTKILVGAGLTQINSIRQWLSDLGASLAPGLGGRQEGSAFAIAILVSYAVDGFLIGYLWTRLHLAGAMQRADVDRLKQEINEMKEKVDLDAKAVSLTIKQLNPSGDKAGPTQQELNDAVKDASWTTRSQIYYLAQTARAENWYEPRNKVKMERTIPVFNALIACDTDDEYHRNHAQLGFALKDQRVPDWTRAEAELSKAIQLRGNPEEHGWRIYEFNRAACRIRLDDSFVQSKASNAENRRRILEDLQVAYKEDYLREIISDDRVVQEWMSLNGAGQHELL